MNEPKHIHDRLDAQDAHVQAAYLTAVSARTLASKTDRDIADLQTPIRASTGVLNALRDTQVEFGRQLAKHGEKLADHSRQLAEVQATLVQHGEQLARHEVRLTELRTEMRNGFAVVDARFERIDARFERLESRFDRRFDELAELIKRSGKTA